MQCRINQELMRSWGMYYFLFLLHCSNIAPKDSLRSLLSYFMEPS